MKRILYALLALLFVAALCGCSHASKSPKHTASPKPSATLKATATPKPAATHKPTASPKTTPGTPLSTSLRDVSGDWPKELKAVPVFSYGTYITYGAQTSSSGQADMKLEYESVTKDNVQAYVSKIENAGLKVTVLTDSDTRYKVQGTLGSGTSAATATLNLELATGDCEVELQYTAAGG